MSNSRPPVVPCSCNEDLSDQIDAFAEALKVESHKIGNHNLSEAQFYDSGIFEGAIQKIRGQMAATMGPKKAFVSLVLSYMIDKGVVLDFEVAGGKNRHDYTIVLADGTKCAIELKGCLDGNNTTIAERPPHAEEFIVWSLCPSASSDIRKGVWSAIHTRLGAEIVDQEKRYDGLIAWDWYCNTGKRPCPKVSKDDASETILGPYILPPPCLYSFPATLPSARNNAIPKVRSPLQVKSLKAFYDCFSGSTHSLNTVGFEVEYRESDLVRRTTVLRNGEIVQQSKFTAIKRR